MPVQQQQYYRDHQGTQFFFSLHPAAEDKATGTAVLLAPAMYEELQEARQAAVNFANGLAEKGITVLRFDYRGQGESGGEMHEYSPSDLVDDICFAFKELQQAGTFKQIGALGVRFGGNLLAVAAREIKPAYLLAWSPIYDGKNYAKTILWTNLTTQMMVHRKIVEDRKVLLQKLEEGKLVDVDGYKLNLEWYNYICNDDLGGHLKAAGVPALMLDISADPEQDNSRWEQFVATLNEAGRSDVAGVRIKGDTFWRLTPLYTVRPKETFETSEEYILKHVHP